MKKKALILHSLILWILSNSDRKQESTDELNAMKPNQHEKQNRAFGEYKAKKKPQPCQKKIDVGNSRIKTLLLILMKPLLTCTAYLWTNVFLYLFPRD